MVFGLGFWSLVFGSEKGNVEELIFGRVGFEYCEGNVCIGMWGGESGWGMAGDADA